MLAFQHVVSGFHILNAAVGAGTDHYLVNLDVGTFLGKVGVLRQVGVADGRLQGIQIDHHGALIFGIGVGFVFGPGTLAAALQVCFAGFVHREDAVFGTGFNGHVADAQAVLHGQALNALAHKFQALVQRAGNADLADQVQDHVLAAHRGVDGTFQLNLDGGRHLEPCHASCHTGGHIGGANAGGKRAHRTVRAGVAVGTNDAVTGGHNALFGQQGMFNTHLADIIKVEDIVFVGKLTALLGLLGTLDILVGHKVVQHNVHAGFIKYRVEPGFLELIDGNRGGNIVAKHNVQLGIDELPGRYRSFAAMRSEDLLCHGHSHRFLLLLL